MDRQWTIGVGRSQRSPVFVAAAAAGLSLAVVLALPGCQGASTQKAPEGASGQMPAAGTMAPSDPVEHGKYLVTVLGCNDCHTPFKMGPNGPEPDMTRMLSGHPADLPALAMPQLPEGWMWAGTATNTAYAGPWGISYAANLTPDPVTGLGGGAWTEETFIQAIRTGKHMGVSRPIMPPMPWPWYSHLTDEDMKAVWAYLRTIPPVQNQVPDYMPPAAPPGQMN